MCTNGAVIGMEQIIIGTALLPILEVRIPAHSAFVAAGLGIRVLSLTAWRSGAGFSRATVSTVWVFGRPETNLNFAFLNFHPFSARNVTKIFRERAKWLGRVCHFKRCPLILHKK